MYVPPPSSSSSQSQSSSSHPFHPSHSSHYSPSGTEEDDSSPTSTPTGPVGMTTGPRARFPSHGGGLEERDQRPNLAQGKGFTPYDGNGGAMQTVTTSSSNNNKTPFLQISGVRPILTVLSLASAVIQMYLAISSLFDIGCILVGAYVLACGILSIILLVALHLMPLLIGRTNCFVVVLRRVCWGLLLILIPGFFVFNIVAALWVHSDNCWDRVYMRNLAVVDIMVTYVIIFVSVWYIIENVILPSGWWTRRIGVKPSVIRIVAWSKQYWTWLLCIICLKLLCGGVYQLYSYNDSASHTCNNRMHDRTNFTLSQVFCV